MNFFYTILLLLRCLSGKESICSSGDTGSSILSLGREDPLDEEMAPLSSILAWEIPWTEELGGLQSMGLQRVRLDSSDLTALAASL